MFRSQYLVPFLSSPSCKEASDLPTVVVIETKSLAQCWTLRSELCQADGFERRVRFAIFVTFLTYVFQAARVVAFLPELAKVDGCFGCACVPMNVTQRLATTNVTETF